MRVVTWNMHGATALSPAWPYLRDLDPDLALLQEVRSVPNDLPEPWTLVSGTAINKLGLHQRFSTALVTRDAAIQRYSLRSARPWVQEELERFGGNLVGSSLRSSSGTLAAMSVYSPAWPIDRERLSGLDTAGVRMPQQKRDVWLADLVLAALAELSPQLGSLIVGGDFNYSETFDAWKGGPRGNREWLDRMAAAGMVECLRASRGQLTPTFRNARGGAIQHQMDHLFVSGPMAERLVRCEVGSVERVFGDRLSDHLPVIADFHEL